MRWTSLACQRSEPMTAPASSPASDPSSARRILSPRVEIKGGRCAPAAPPARPPQTFGRRVAGRRGGAGNGSVSRRRSRGGERGGFGRLLTSGPTLRHRSFDGRRSRPRAPFGRRYAMAAPPLTGYDDRATRRLGGQALNLSVYDAGAKFTVRVQVRHRTRLVVTTDDTLTGMNRSYPTVPRR